MPKRITSKKFTSPPLKGEKFHLNKVGDTEICLSGSSEEVKSKASKSRPVSESHYDDVFTAVLGHTQLNNDETLANILLGQGNKEEDEVAVPEPNAALSPAESAEEGSSESLGTAVKTPDQRIDNSVLPPIKRKKPESRIAHLNLKVKPIKLNFDDPALMELPENS